jgi:hypothetical protein
MTDLILENKNQPNETAVFGGGAVMMTPMVDEDYWTYRVRLSEKQAVLGFPKFLTVSIGFAQEEDWNTNFPYTCDTEEIFQHIKHNKGDDSIADDDVRVAIKLIQDAATADRSAS